jgi:hypothetical protein
MNMKSRLGLITLTAVFSLSFLGGHAMAAGALAIDSNQGGQYGFAHGYKTTNQAAQKALSECGSGCQVVLEFNSGCGAYAADQSSGSTAYGWGTGSSSSAAQNTAVSECQSRGGSRCITRSYACD